MDGRERYLRALHFAGPDRVPVMHRTLPGAFRRFGRALEELYERYPSDVLLHPSSRTWFGFNRGVGEGSGKYQGAVDEWGCVWDSLSDDYLGQVVGHPLDEWHKLEDYHFPAPETGQEGLADLGATVQADGHQHYVPVMLGTLWQQYFWLRGFENALFDVLEDRAEMYELRDRLVKFMLQRLEIILRQKEHVDGIQINDDWGSQQALLINPVAWRRIYKPAYARLVEAIHASGCQAHLHSDGHIAAIVPDLIELGFDEINPQVSCMDLGELRGLCRDKICVRADVDRQYFLAYGTPAEMRGHVRQLYDTFASPRGGYIGYGEAAPETPLANVEAMLASFYELPRE
ncbi:MAG: uroporphyrinogen decarboxylase family protein [Chloroflexota bacterium]